eukprot:6084955-Prymnesium_polylepis.2
MVASRNGREGLELNASQDGGRVLTPVRLETHRGRLKMHETRRSLDSLRTGIRAQTADVRTGGKYDMNYFEEYKLLSDNPSPRRQSHRVEGRGVRPEQVCPKGPGRARSAQPLCTDSAA